MQQRELEVLKGESVGVVAMLLALVTCLPHDVKQGVIMHIQAGLQDACNALEQRPDCTTEQLRGLQRVAAAVKYTLEQQAPRPS